ncbi:hypothetical protein [Vitiosangium sp. GDMCC 1.1324]|uniref:hypothetical protein n=1 Tax=Vitiosangium sp. (strain GDMCC 1.1324) TaxID=2138576 RepID=UPI000D3AA18B|nr:hypothetical protein [Vitiosangium sp. GDMCC 1.1324]PTL81128.1 hypothetical protein DAT35_23665 [Vitiosangium sp. GDMCC 1.1324]
MSWRIRGLLGAAALVVLTSCGVSEDEAVRLKEGQRLFEEDIDPNYWYCSTLGCVYEGQACLEVFFEYGRSPALCLFVAGDNGVCNKVECAKEGRECAIFDGFPGQVKCIDKKK